MVKHDYNVERTAAGDQYVIPGTEKPVARSRVRYANDGDQLVIPGAERIGTKPMLDRFSQKPLRPRVGQRSPAGTPLFGTGR